MYIKEMVFANKHYKIQEECRAVLKVLEDFPIQSMHIDYNGPESKPSAWWSYSKISISFKVEFESMAEMYAVCQPLKMEELGKKDKFGRVLTCEQETAHKIFGEILRILEKNA